MTLSERARTLLTVAAVVGIGALLLWRPIASFGHGLWGPENAWTNRDFLGAWWLFWASGRPEDWLAATNWPDGGLPLQHHVPNPFDAWLLGPLVAGLSFPLWWNVLQLSTHLANLGAAALLARSAGARAWPTVGAMALVAASPVMLHEVAGGRTISGVVWPGLCALALLSSNRRPHGLGAGLLLGVQALAYAYNGLLFGIAALVLQPRAARFWVPVAVLVVAPWLWWLSPVLTGTWASTPPSGHTVVPLSGLVGFGPERFQLHPLLLAGLVVAIATRSWRWLVVGAIALLVTLGPAVEWTRGHTAFTSPLAWITWALPGLDRMHHPVRAALLLAPVLGVVLAKGLDRLPRWTPMVALAMAVANLGAVQRACSWDVGAEPPGAALARSLAGEDGAIVDLTGGHGAALGLQSLHQRPMLEGLRRERPQEGRQNGALLQRTDGWLAGERQPGLAQELRAAGFSEVIVIDRGQPVDTAALEADLGPPGRPGVWSLR